MGELEEIAESDLPKGAELVGRKKVSYSFAGCCSLGEAKRKIYREVARNAPEGATCFVSRASCPNRSAGIAGQGPIIFTVDIDYFR